MPKESSVFLITWVFPVITKNMVFFLPLTSNMVLSKKIMNPEGKKVSDPTEPTAQWVVPIHLSCWI
jgi:hypothetical protein